jgi:hypothetical protein
MLCGLVGGYQHFYLRPANGCDTFHKNVGHHHHHFKYLLVSWVVMLYGLAGGYQHIIFHPANGCDPFHQNVGNHV